MTSKNNSFNMSKIMCFHTNEVDGVINQIHMTRFLIGGRFMKDW